MMIDGIDLALPTGFENADPAHERSSFLALRRLLRPGAIVCDAGSDRGILTALMAILARENCRIHSVEPREEAQACANELAAANHLSDRIVPYNCLLGERNGDADFYLI